MSSKLVTLEKLSRKNRYGKCDWSVELEVHENHAVYSEKQVFIKRTLEEVITLLRTTCNCTVSREVVR